MAMLVGHWQLRGFGMWAVEARATGTRTPSGRLAERLGERWSGDAEIRRHRVSVYAIERDTWLAIGDTP